MRGTSKPNANNSGRDDWASAFPGLTVDRHIMRTFETGATRDSEDGKLDFEGFLHPLVLERFAEYMHSHRQQADGALRPSDNWQRGIPKDAYMKSAFRHFRDWWIEHRGYLSKAPGLSPYERQEDALCALLFNVMGYLSVLLLERKYHARS